MTAFESLYFFLKNLAMVPKKLIGDLMDFTLFTNQSTVKLLFKNGFPIIDTHSNKCK
jgi:hypothetical protein